MTDKAFVKGLNLLTAMANSSCPRGVASLSEELGMTPSNTHRLLRTLVDHGFVEQTEKKGGYRLTTRLWELGAKVVSRLDFLETIREQMPILAARAEESVHVSVLDGYEVIYLDKIESQHDLRANTCIGSRAPAWGVATGKAMLAYKPEEVVDGLGAHLLRFTDTTLSSMAEVREEFVTIRSEGIAYNRGEWREDVYGAATPIWDSTGRVVASIGISGPASRLSTGRLEELSGEVLEIGRKTSQLLGYLGDPRIAGREQMPLSA